MEPTGSLQFSLKSATLPSPQRVVFSPHPLPICSRYILILYPQVPLCITSYLFPSDILTKMLYTSVIVFVTKYMKNNFWLYAVWLTLQQICTYKICTQNFKEIICKIFKLHYSTQLFQLHFAQCNTWPQHEHAPSCATENSINIYRQEV
jgi:hypothetical protein